MHNLMLMTGNITSSEGDIEMLVLEITGKEVNLLRDAHELAGSMADRTGDIASSASLSITRNEGARAFRDLPYAITQALEEGYVETLERWVNSDECLAKEVVLENHRLSVESNLNGSLKVFFREKYADEQCALETLQLTDISSHLFWEAHGVGDALGTLPNSWVGIVTRAVEEEEALQEFEVPVVRSSYSKPRVISVMARNKKEANEKALEEAGNHEFRENYAEYSLAPKV